MAYNQGPMYGNNQGHYMTQGQVQQQHSPYIGMGSNVVVTKPAPHVGSNPYYNGWQSSFVGICLIITGLGCIAFNAAALALSKNDNNLVFVGHGFWGGAAFILTGILGISAGRTKYNCPIVTFMTFSIITTLVGGLVISFAGYGLAVVDGRKDDCEVYMNNWNKGYYGPNKTQDYYECQENFDAMMALDILLILGGVIGAGLALWGSILGCTVRCCITAPYMYLDSTDMVHPVATSGQQPMVYPPAPIGAQMHPGNKGVPTPISVTNVPGYYPAGSRPTSGHYR